MDAPPPIEQLNIVVSRGQCSGCNKEMPLKPFALRTGPVTSAVFAWCEECCKEIAKMVMEAWEDE